MSADNLPELFNYVPEPGAKWADPPNSIRLPMEEAKKELHARISFGRTLQAIRVGKNLETDDYATRLGLQDNDILLYEHGLKPLPTVAELEGWANQLGLNKNEKLTLIMSGGYPIPLDEDHNILRDGIRELIEEQKRLPKLNFFTLAKMLLRIKVDEIKNPLR